MLVLSVEQVSEVQTLTAASSLPFNTSSDSDILRCTFVLVDQRRA